MSQGMGCNKEKMEAYMASLQNVIQGNVVRENFNVLLAPVKKVHEEAGIQLSKELVEKTEAFIQAETVAVEELFVGVSKTVNHIYTQAEQNGAFEVA